MRHTVIFLFFLLVASLAAAQTTQSHREVFVAGPNGERDTLWWYVGAPAGMRVTTNPDRRSVEASGGARVVPLQAAGEFLVVIERPRPGITPVCIDITGQRPKDMPCMTVVVFQPLLRDGIAHWDALKAIEGRKYDPSSAWLSEKIPASHYHTIVEYNGAVVLDSTGTSFDPDTLPESLRIRATTSSIRTRVFWRPAGTDDRSKWVLLASTSPADEPHVALGAHRVVITDE